MLIKSYADEEMITFQKHALLAQVNNSLSVASPIDGVHTGRKWECRQTIYLLFVVFCLKMSSSIKFHFIVLL